MAVSPVVAGITLGSSILPLLAALPACACFTFLLAGEVRHSGALSTASFWSLAASSNCSSGPSGVVMAVPSSSFLAVGVVAVWFWAGLAGSGTD